MTKHAATVEIRRVSDGAVRTMERQWEFDDDPGHGDEFMWSDGNYACDCNRCGFFHDARDEERPETRPCGEGAYDVRITTPDGRVLYEDGNWP